MTLNNNIFNGLIEYGMSEHEVRIYTYLLKTIDASVFDIAKSTNIPRTTTYSLLEKMKQKGTVATFKKNKVVHYTPSNPTNLYSDLEKRGLALSSIMQDLQDLTTNKGVRPHVQLFTGKEGIKILLEDILSTCKSKGINEIYVAAHPDLLDALPKYFPKWLERRAAAKVFAHLIVPETTRNRKEFYSGYFRETRFLPANFFFQCTMDIYGDKLGFFSFKDGEIYSIIIESATIAQIFKQFFVFTWEMLNKNRAV